MQINQLTPEAQITRHFTLTHIILASFLWEINKQNSPDVTPQNAESHLGLFYLPTGNLSKNEIKILMMPLKGKWTHPNDKDGKVNS